MSIKKPDKQQMKVKINQMLTDSQLVCKLMIFLSTTILLNLHSSMGQSVQFDRDRTEHITDSKIHQMKSVPSISNSCPWLPSRVRDRKGAKSTKISRSKGATFSKARSSFVVMLLKKTHQKSQKNIRNNKCSSPSLLCISTFMDSPFRGLSN